VHAAEPIELNYPLCIPERSYLDCGLYLVCKRKSGLVPGDGGRRSAPGTGYADVVCG